MSRPYCTLFMLQSLDGKISTGSTDDRDFDKDLPSLISGLDDYYEAEQHTDMWSMISGATAVKLGANRCKFPSQPHACKHIIIDSHKLSQEGINHISDSCKEMILITDPTMPERVAVRSNMRILHMSMNYTFASCMQKLYEELEIHRITVQTGGTLNSKLFREGLIDAIDVFIAPIIVGGRSTPTLVDGMEFFNEYHLELISKLLLVSTQVTEHGFVRLQYTVSNNDRSQINSYSKKFLERF